MSAATGSAQARERPKLSVVRPKMGAWATEEITPLERSILDFELAWENRAGNREAAIRSALGYSATRHYQALHALIDTARAERAEPLLVHRLRRLRGDRRRARSLAYGLTKSG